MKDITKEKLKEMTLDEIAAYRFIALSDEESELILMELRRRGC